MRNTFKKSKTNGRKVIGRRKQREKSDARIFGVIKDWPFESIGNHITHIRHGHPMLSAGWEVIILKAIENNLIRIRKRKFLIIKKLILADLISKVTSDISPVFFISSDKMSHTSEPAMATTLNIHNLLQVWYDEFWNVWEIRLLQKKIKIKNKKFEFERQLSQKKRISNFIQRRFY